MDKALTYSVAINILTFFFALYVLGQSSKRLKINDGLLGYRLFLVFGAAFTIVAVWLSLLINFCSATACASFGRLFAVTSIANATGRLVIMSMLAVIYFKDGQCVGGKKDRDNG